MTSIQKKRSRMVLALFIAAQLSGFIPGTLLYINQAKAMQQGLASVGGKSAIFIGEMLGMTGIGAVAAYAVTKTPGFKYLAEFTRSLRGVPAPAAPAGGGAAPAIADQTRTNITRAGAVFGALATPILTHTDIPQKIATTSIDTLYPNSAPALKMAHDVSDDFKSFLAVLYRRTANWNQFQDDMLVEAQSNGNWATVKSSFKNGLPSQDVMPIMSALVHEGKNTFKTLEARSRLALAYADYEMITRYIKKSYPGAFAVWMINNPVSMQFRTNGNVQLATLLAIGSAVARDSYYYYYKIKPVCKKMMPYSDKPTSISTRSAMIIKALYRVNGNENNTKSNQEKITEMIETLRNDIVLGSITIRDASTNESIDISSAEGKENALNPVNIAYTIDQELAETEATLTYLSTYNRNIDFTEDIYQAGWKYDIKAAGKAAKIAPGAQCFEITADAAEKRDTMMKEEDGMWEVLQSDKLFGMPYLVYPKRLPFYLQPSRWICSYGMPWTYKRAKKEWWDCTKQKEHLEFVRKLLVTLPN